MYIVFFSKDPYLLARMGTELQMEGYTKRLRHIDGFDPFHSLKHNYMFIGDTLKHEFNYGNHKGFETPVRLWLTEKNYIEYLSFVLKNKNK